MSNLENEIKAKAEEIRTLFLQILFEKNIDPKNKRLCMFVSEDNLDIFSIDDSEESSKYIIKQRINFE